MSKKNIIFIFLILFSYIVFSQNILNKNGKENTKISLFSQTKEYISFTQEFNYLSLNKIVLNGETFYNLFMGEEFNKSNSIGQANLPTYNSLISIPVCENIEIEENVLEKETYQLEQNILIAPSQPSQSKQNEDIPFSFDEKYYSRKSFGENLHTKVHILGIMGGNKLARLSICPIRYNPSTNTIEIAKKVSVKVKFINVDYKATSSLQNKRNTIASFSEQYTLNKNTTLQDKPYKMVIVAPDSFQPTLQPFISWKRQQGFIVVEAYTSEIGNDTNSIRSYLYNLYTNDTLSPDYLLICGDTPQIPSFEDRYGGLDHHYTDLYYAEYTSDFLPDVFYGRMSARDTATLSSILQKTITYEKYLLDDDSYLNRSLLVAGKETSYPATTVTNGQNNYSKTYLSDYTDTSIYYNPDSGLQVGAILEDINNGQAWVNYSAHCVEAGWYLPAVRTNSVDQFTNIGKYGVFINNCCSAGAFSETTCFSEKLLQVENKGAVASIAASDYTYWEEDYYWSVGNKSLSLNASYNENNLGAYDRFFHTHNETREEYYTTMGQMIVAGNLAVEMSGTDMANYYWEVYNLQGDPTLIPYVGIPQEIDATYSKVYDINTNTFTITTIPYAYVSLTLNDTVIDAKETNEEGIALLNLSNVTSPCYLSLVVTAQFYKPLMDSIKIVAEGSPFINVSNLTITEESEGIVERVKEETYYNIDITVKNDGLESLVSSSNDNLTITSNSNTVEYLSNNLHTIHNLLPDKDTTITINLKTKQGIKQNDDLLLTLCVNGDSYTKQINIPISIKSPILEIDNLTLLQQEDSIYISFDLINNGLLTTKEGEVSIDEIMVYDTVAPLSNRESTRKIFAFLNNDEEYLDLNIEYVAGNYQTTSVLHTRLKGFLETFETRDFSLLAWDTTDDNSWEIDTIVSYSGKASARSKNGLDHNEISKLSLKINTFIDDSISFYYKTSTDKYFDILYFQIDGNTKLNVSGENDWTYKSFALPKGEHIVAWYYEKNYYRIAGLDAVWIDNVKIPENSLFVGLEENAPILNDINIYPNPTKDILYIEGVKQNDVITLCDVTGKLVYQKKANSEKEMIDVSHISSGVYYLFVQNKYINNKSKIIISKTK